MAKILTADALISKDVTPRDRILLLNPPVEETRYSWVKWNQPLDLLKIASHLRSKVGCDVNLLDCMRPDKSGNVPEEWLSGGRRYYKLGGERYPIRRFGMSYGELMNRLVAIRREKGGEGPPTQVWVTTLCSFWYESVAEVCRIIRQTLPDTMVVLLGQYARLMAKHAALVCAADCVITRPIELSDELAAFDLYGEKTPPFLALRLNPTTAVAEVSSAIERGVLRFTFFEEDICQDDGEPLQEIFEKTKGLHKNLRYHFICGLCPAKVTPAIARIIADKQVAEAHFEEAEADSELDVSAYRKVRAYLQEAGLKDAGDRLSGFVWIGRPGDELDRIILRSFHVLDHLGGLILKPFTPTPGSPEHHENESYLAAIPHRNWSPHFFPFAELNGITQGEYHDLYRMAAFLNERIGNGTFDFLKGTMGAQLLRESLRREAWKLEGSPLRLVD
jgi:CheY-like chemotaxis protein